MKASWKHPRALLFLLFVFGACLISSAQSNLGSITGTVRDASGALLPHATITLHRTQSNTDSTVTTNSDGTYTALNVDPGTYNLTATANNFAPEVETGLQLTARQQLRLDITLAVTGTSATVTVNASDAGTIDTDNATISAALSPRDVLDLPANYRGAGSTSPLNVIQTLPGVQPDSGNFPPSPSASPNPSVKFSIQGGLPSQSETTVDGISAQNQTNNDIQADAFPSAESIAEIRVDGVGTNAEFGQPGEITTVTKALHGSAFWYFQNRAFDAIPYGFTAATKPQKVANDFGVSAGGPVVIPHLYNGHDKSFFFGTYEGLRYPLAIGRHLLVPTARMKQGDFSQETATLTNPFTNAPYPGARLPSVNPSAAAFLSLYPDPNFGNTQSVQAALAGPGYNYIDTRRNDIYSNQYDLRFDQTVRQRLTFFARYTGKSINQAQPADLKLPDGTAYSRYHIFAASANLTLTPRLVNEFRFGFTFEQDGNANPFNGTALTQNAGFQGLTPTPPFNGFSHVNFNQLTSSGERLNGNQRSRILQYVDNVTWQRGNHTLRFGADIRHLGAYTIRSFYPADNYGNFYFNGTFTGQEFADYLIGTPYFSALDNISSDNVGTSNAYAVYAQDSWKATTRLTLSFGLRYELHPASRPTPRPSATSTPPSPNPAASCTTPATPPTSTPRSSPASTPAPPPA